MEKLNSLKMIPFPNEFIIVEGFLEYEKLFQNSSGRVNRKEWLKKMC